MENNKVQCPLCNSYNIKIEYKNVKDIEHKVVKGNFNYYKCNNCGLIFMYPLPTLEKVSSFYPSTYQCYSNSSIENKSKIKELIKKYFGFLFLDRVVEKNFGKIFNLFKKPINDLNILEYGCGGCNMLLNLKNNFNLKDTQILGVDFSKDAIKNCKNSGVNAKQVYKIDEVEGKFDIIYAFQVLEHLLDPQDFIDKCYSKLNKGGGIVSSIA